MRTDAKEWAASLKASDTVYKEFSVDMQALEGRRVKFTITTSHPDRECDVVDAEGVELESFLRNPVVLFAHNYRALPVARCVQIERRPGSLIATTEFATEDMNPEAEKVYRMIKAGFLRASSIGFRPLEWTYNEERRGVDFKRVELLEYSIVPVPANAMALIAAGVDGTDGKMLKAWAESTLAALNEAEAELSKTAKEKLLNAATNDVLVAPFDADELGWKAFVKARNRARAKGDLTDQVIADILEDYGFDAEAQVIRGGAKPAEKEAVAAAAADAQAETPAVKDEPEAKVGDTKLAVDVSAEVLAQVDARIAEALASVKTGRVLSKTNETKLREAGEALLKAKEHIDTVLSAVDQEAADDGEGNAPAVEAATEPEVVLALDDDAEELLLELGLEAEEAEVELVEIDTAELAGVIRDAMTAVVRQESRAAIDALRGRID